MLNLFNYSMQTRRRQKAYVFLLRKVLHSPVRTGRCGVPQGADPAPVLILCYFAPNWKAATAMQWGDENERVLQIATWLLPRWSMVFANTTNVCQNSALYASALATTSMGWPTFRKIPILYPHILKHIWVSHCVTGMNRIYMSCCVHWDPIHCKYMASMLNQYIHRSLTSADLNEDYLIRNALAELHRVKFKNIHHKLAGESVTV